ncbi:MAG: DUF92 domain-containing protein [Candidatus Thermoplasmatota archaeon]|nr:DUF92 domain-containing protein [Candidatus Thermoplasmatota archaeon]
MENTVITIILCSTLVLIAYWRRVFDAYGCLAAFFIGLAIGILGSLLWLLMLLIFLISSFLATKFKFEYKKSRGLQEGIRGERHIGNVLTNGGVPVIIAFLKYFWRLNETIAAIMFITAIAVAAADTLASEIGVLSDKTYLIINLKKRVAPGTNGGVSLIGTSAALFASLYVAVIGCILCSIFNIELFIIPLLLGFLGCNIDSLLGATLEKKVITKGMVNYISIAISTIIAVLWTKLLF